MPKTLGLANFGRDKDIAAIAKYSSIGQVRYLFVPMLVRGGSMKLCMG